MDFRDSLKCNVNIQELLHSRFGDDTAKGELFYSELIRYHEKFNSQQAQDFFHNLVVAIMLAYNRYFEAYGIECNYRFKSPKSLADKIVNYILRPEKNNGTNDTLGIQEISDVFAMNLILTDRPSSFHSKDPKIKALIKERNENQEFVTKMQEFKSNLIEDEFSITPTYIYRVTKKEYYTKCLEIIDRLISIFPPEATDLIDKYETLRSNIHETLNFFLETMPEDTLVDETDYPLKNPDKPDELDFIGLLDSFLSRISDKIDLAILTKQAMSIFENSELIQKLGVSIDDYKEKRAPSGYTSNFIYLRTPLGVIECQLQSKNQFRDGNIGDSAHTKMSGKSIKGFKIPNPENPEEVKKFKSSVLYIAPKFYVARIDDVEEGRVIIQEYTDYKSYRKVLGQVQKGSVQEKKMFSYFERLYSLRDTIFDSQGSTQEFILYDIMKYLRSDELSKIKGSNAERE